MLSDKSQERIRICRERFDAAPDSRSFAPLADALRQAGLHEEALGVLEAGIERHPRFVGAQVILGHTLLDAGRPEHARRVLRSVLDGDGDNVVALRLLTEDARSRQAWLEAVPLLQKVVALDPEDERWPQALAEARANRDVVDPADVPETSFATMTLVEIYLAQGYRAKAMTALRQMQVREPDRQDIREKIAEIGILEGGRAKSDQPLSASGDLAGLPQAYAKRREVMAAKRAVEKKNFEEWITRVRSDESAAP